MNRAPTDIGRPAESFAGALDDGPSTLTRPVASLNAVQAAQRIRTWHTVLRSLSATAQHEIMESAYIIRRAYPERVDFDRFVLDQALDDTMTADQAWIAAETWEVARRQRSLRDLAATQPSDAMEFVQQFIAAAGDDGITQLDSEDRRVADILARPARQRHSAIRALLAERDEAERGRSPVDVEAIRTLTEERDEALETIERMERDRRVARATDAPVERARSLDMDLMELLGTLAEIRVRVRPLVERHPTGARSAALDGALSCILARVDAIATECEYLQAELATGTDGDA